MNQPRRPVRPSAHSLLGLSLLCLVGGALAGTATGQESSQPTEPRPGEEGPTVTLTLTGQQRAQIRLAHPALELTGTPGRPVAEAARELDDALRQDLDWSGIFVIQGPTELRAAQLTGQPERDFEIYRSLGNEALLETLVRQDGDKLVLEGRLYDLASGRAILGKRYSGGPELARRIAHTFADEIVRYISGRRGIALTRIAFYSDRTGDREIYLMDYDGHSVRRITGHRTISMSPAWSGSREEIAYVTFLHGPPGIFLVDLLSSEKLPVLDDGNHNLSPSFSPDGKRLVFARSLSGNWEIFTCRRDGSDLRRLTHSSAIDTNPAWSPTGREIAFTSSRSGTPQIYLMDAEGANLRRISRDGDYNDGAAWGPQGDRLAYASRRRGVFEIVLTDLVTREEQVLTHGPGSSEAPSFSPDGRKLAFARTVSGHSGRETQIWMVDADGARERQLTREGSNFAPSWSGWRE